MKPFNARLAVLLAVLLPTVALAQSSRTWTITTVASPGDAQPRVVMDEASELTVDVRNTSNNNSRRMTDVAFVLPDGYTVLNTAAPTGWRVNYVDVGGRLIIFSTTASCATGTNGLGQGGQVRFTLRMIPPSAGADRLTERFATGTRAYDSCQGDQTFTIDLPTSGSWVLSGLSSSVSVRPPALGVGEETEARVVVENRTSANQAGITATLSSTGSATFTPVAAPTSVSIPQYGAGIVTTRVRATAPGGTAVGRVRASNAGGTVTSQFVDTRMVNVGPLASSVDVDNVQVLTGATGEPVQVRMTVTNTSTTDTLSDVRPRALVGLGTATRTALSGPIPASVSRLAPGASAHFVWRYQVSGAEGADYLFQAQVDATRSGAAVAGNLVDSARGRIVAHRVRISPESLPSGATNQTVVYTVQNRGTRPIVGVKLLWPAANYFTQPGGFVTPDGWSVFGIDASGISWDSDTGTGIPVGEERSFSVVYTSLGSVPVPAAFRHRLNVIEDYNEPLQRIEAPVTLLGGTAPEVERLTAVARDASVTLTWDNPALHGGVVVLRAEGASPNTAPAPGRSYAVGDVVGNARVVYTDAFSAASTFTDTTVTNGTTYYYRVHNADDMRWYSAGNRPTSAGLLATPRARLSGAPLWCYSVGLDARTQPITELGVGIFSSFNNSVVANLTQVSNPSQDGAERWRPLPLTGLIGSRFPVVPLRGLPGQYILVGDQNGVGYAINASSGQVLWRWDNGGNPIGTIQSFPVTQLHDFANAAYQAAHPGRDLVFFATRLANPALNRVVALNAATGALVWTYQPGDLGMISGGMVVDYANNRLFIGTKSNGSTATLRVLNTLTTGPAAQEVARLPVGDIDLSLVRNASSNLIYATASDGTVHAVSVATLQLAWSIPVATPPAPNTPAFTSFVRPQGMGFVASLAAGRVEFWDTASAAVTPALKWSTPIANPSGVFSFNLNAVARVYVGSSDGRVHQLELTNGADSAQVSIGGAQLIGTPTIDSTATVRRLHVGSQDGRICAFTVPFQ